VDEGKQETYAVVIMKRQLALAALLLAGTEQLGGKNENAN